MCDTVDLSKIPVLALRKATIGILSGGLNPHKVIPTDEGLPRDWRGLAHLIGLNGVETSRIASSKDPIAELLNHWGPQGNIERLRQFLALIDRFDVLYDAKALLEKDVEVFLTKATSPSLSQSVISSEDSDWAILTVDDVARIDQGLDPQYYDAYLLHAEEDIGFASEIIHNMEQQHKMKLCIRDRDLVGGLSFEHDAIMKLIAERCRRLLVVVTPNFLKSPANKFFVTFAQALGIDQRQRKVIPILYEKCDLPPELSYYFLLDYSRAGVLWNFWDKLRDSIQVPDASPTNNPIRSPWMSRTHVTQTTPLSIETTATSKSAVQEQPPSLESDSNKKPLLKNITSSLSNLVMSNGSREKINSSQKKKAKGSEETSITSGTKASKKKWFRRKKVEPLFS